MTSQADITGGEARPAILASVASVVEHIRSIALETLSFYDRENAAESVSAGPTTGSIESAYARALNLILEVLDDYLTTRPLHATALSARESESRQTGLGYPYPRSD